MSKDHIFRCPKCGMTSAQEITEGKGVGILVNLKTKLHLGCCRCGWKWIEDTLDKREQMGDTVGALEVREGQFDITKEE